MGTVPAQRDGSAKVIVAVQRHVDICTAGITFANGPDQGTTFKIAIGKGHQVHGTKIPAVAGWLVAVVIRRTNHQLPGIGTERHRRARLITIPRFGTHQI